MKILFGAIVTDGRNKIGGHVASKNKGGNYLRTKVTPTNPQTASQSGVRSDFAGLAQSWRGLTQAQRDGWNAGAVNFPYTDIFGSTKIYSGFNLYMKLNGNLNNVGAALLDDCPSPSSITPFTMLAASNDGGALHISTLPSPIPVGYSAIVMASPGLSAGRAYSASSMRKIKVYEAADVPGVVTGDYEAKYGFVPPTTENVYFSMFLVLKSTGQVSQQLTTLVLPA